LSFTRTFARIGLGLLVGALACANRGMEAPSHDAAAADGGHGGLAGRAGGGAGSSQATGVAGQAGGAAGAPGVAGTGAVAGTTGLAGSAASGNGGAPASPAGAGGTQPGVAGSAGAASGGAGGSAQAAAGRGGGPAGAGGAGTAGAAGGGAGAAGGVAGAAGGAAGAGGGVAGAAGAGRGGAGVAGSGVAGRGGAGASADAGADGPTCASRFNFEGGALYNARISATDQTGFTALSNVSDAFCGGGALALQATIDATNVKGEMIIPFAQAEDLSGKTFSVALKATPAGTDAPLAIVFVIPSYTVVTAFSPLPGAWMTKTATLPSGADGGATAATGLAIQVLGRNESYSGTITVDEIDIR
jgi:hypothetical protein